MSTAIKYTGAFTNRTGMRQLIASPTPIAGTVRDYAAQTLTIGTLTTWPEANGGLAMTTTGLPTVVQEGALKYLRFNGTTQWAKEDTVSRTQPHTFYLRYRLQGTPVANKPIVGSALAGGISYAVTSGGTNVQLFAGTALTPAVVALDTNWHTAILVVNGANSVISIDGVEKVGNPGANGGAGIRIAAGSATPSSFTAMDVIRIGVLPHAADATERAAILAAIS